MTLNWLLYIKINWVGKRPQVATGVIVNYSSPALLFLRRALRFLGLNVLLRKTQLLTFGFDSESKFSAAIAPLLREGDEVWDIGANKGDYSEWFLRTVGLRGRVVAFEPSSLMFKTLVKKFGVKPNVDLQKIALSDHSGFANFSVLPNPLNNKLLGPEDPGGERVQMDTIDNFSSNHQCVPNGIKIDVEGAERAVLCGAIKTLKDEKLIWVGVEIHHNIITESGRPNDVRLISDILEQSGFKIKWTDSSHLVAARIDL